MKKYLIIGGTGSLGKEMAAFLTSKNKNVTIFSRNETNQVKLKSIFPGVNFMLGDIRDYEAINKAMAGMYCVMHFAALKHVDIIEKNIEESIKTNILGSLNCGRAALANGIERFVFSSTDKGVLPINVYGMCKAISERYFNSLNDDQNDTRFRVYRWGNVIASSGSAIPFFIKSLKETGSVNITDKNMTRFWIHLRDAVKFIWETFDDHSKSYPAFIPVMKAASIERVVKVLATILKLPNYNIKYIGIRPGEKIHECLYSDHEVSIHSNTCSQYSDEELFELLGPICQMF